MMLPSETQPQSDLRSEITANSARSVFGSGARHAMSFVGLWTLSPAQAAAPPKRRHPKVKLAPKPFGTFELGLAARQCDRVAKVMD